MTSPDDATAQPPHAPDQPPALPGWLERLGRARTYSLIMALCLSVAVARRFVQDDAYISFRYARHLAEGQGLVFNAGEQVEGYTNFLWVVVLAACHAAGLDMVVAAQALGVLAFGGALWVTARLVERHTGQWAAGAAAMLVLGTNATVNAYATGGLATALQALEFVLTIWCVDRLWAAERLRPAALAGFGLLLAAAQLTRPDSGLLVVVAAGGWVAGELWGRAGGRRLRPWHVLIPAGISGAIVAVWAAWKLSFYGHLLPNTFYAKQPHDGLLSMGIFYTGRFVCDYGLALILPLVLIERRKDAHGSLEGVDHRALKLGLLVSALWCLYILRVGGGFMEFRFFVPIAPLLVAGFVVALWRWHPSWRARGVVIAALLAGSIFHATTFKQKSWPDLPMPWIASIDELRGYGEVFAKVGQQLGEDLARDPSVTACSTAIGGLGYYGGMTLIDMHGLTDAHIARHGTLDPLAPAGHQRLATPEHLIHERKVHLWISGPSFTITPDARALETISDETIVTLGLKPAQLPAGAQVLRVPLRSGGHILILSLRPHPRVTALVQSGRWVVVPRAPARP